MVTPSPSTTGRRDSRRPQASPNGHGGLPAGRSLDHPCVVIAPAVPHGVLLSPGGRGANRRAGSPPAASLGSTDVSKSGCLQDECIAVDHRARHRRSRNPPLAAADHRVVVSQRGRARVAPRLHQPERPAVARARVARRGGPPGSRRGCPPGHRRPPGEVWLWELDLAELGVPSRVTSSFTTWRYSDMAALRHRACRPP